jgi:hypothetical protein
MSGYLRWLAERALGPASGLRPARRPRSFAGEPSRNSDSAATFVETARPRDFGPVERQFDAPLPDRTDAAGSDAMPATPLTSVAPPATAQTIDFPVAAASQDADTPAPQSGADVERRVDRADRPRLDDPPRRAEPEIADGATSSRVSGHHRVVPQAALTPRMATRLARNRPAGDPSDRRGEALPAPDVHIHIGRVELTAITSAAPPRRESAANKKPMSLEEYLRRRSGRPS